MIDSLTKRGGTRFARLALVVMVLGVAAFLRLYRIDSLPPGLFYDEAMNGLDVLDILQGKLSVYFERCNGREPLFIYLQAISAYLLGPSVVALRLVAALIGIATVMTTFLLAREWFGYRVGLLSMAGIAVAFWHVDLSRVGFRAISTPLLLTLALLFLWKARRTGRMVHFATAGVLLGLTLYTYTSARLAPLLFVAIVLVELLLYRQELLRQWRGLTALVVAAAVTCSPLGAYFAAHPEALLTRAQQVSIVSVGGVAGTDLDAVWQSLSRIAGMFFLSGDVNWRHNILERPVFGPIAGACFVLGFVWVVSRLRRTRGLLPRAEVATSADAYNSPAAYWLLLWFFIMMIPGVFSDGSPHFLRLTAIAPSVFIVAALGYCLVWRFLARYLSRGANAAVILLLVATIGREGLATTRDYFLEWANRPEVYWAFDTHLTEAANSILHLEGSDSSRPPVVYADVQRLPSLDFLLQGEPDAAGLIESSDRVMALPGDNRWDVYYLQDRDTSPGLLAQVFPNMPVHDQRTAPDGTPAFTLYRIPGELIDDLKEPEKPVNVVFGDRIELVGVNAQGELSEGLASGSTWDVTLLWRLRAKSNEVYNFFVHLVDEKGRTWAQGDQRGGGFEAWERGDLVLSHHRVTLPTDMPAIPLKVMVGVSLISTGERLIPETAEPCNWIKLYDTAGRRDEVASPLGNVDPRQRELVPGLRVMAEIPSDIVVKQGGTLGVDLVWHLDGALARDPIIELRLIDAEGQVVARQEGAPGYGYFPFARWKVGDVVRDPRSMTLGGQSSGGVGRLVLTALDPDGRQQLGEVLLGEVTIEQPTREYSLPMVQHKVDITLGDQIRLLGYDLNQESMPSDGCADLTLYWQAISIPTENYTVFVHLIDEGEVIVGQQDSSPVQGTRPTTGWVPNEVIADRYQIPLKIEPKADELTLAIGVYEPNSGQRLTIEGFSDGRAIVGKIKVDAR